MRSHETCYVYAQPHTGQVQTCFVEVLLYNCSLVTIRRLKAAAVRGQFIVFITVLRTDEPMLFVSRRSLEYGTDTIAGIERRIRRRPTEHWATACQNSMPFCRK